MKPSDKQPTDLVSVIVPSYGHGKYIFECLESVTAQTYKNIEIIIIDDCSNDSSFEIANNWAKEPFQKERFNNVLVKQNTTNCGAHETINRGITLAQGKYISLLNSDDYYSPNRIEIMMNAAQKNQSTLLFSSVKVVDNNGKHVIDSGLSSEIESMSDFADFFPSISTALLYKNIAVSTGNLFFSRKLIQQIGVFRSLRYCHDWDFLLRACLVTEPLLITAPLYNYRMHSSNSFSTLKIESFIEPQLIYYTYIQNCKSGNCINPTAPNLSNWPGLFETIVGEFHNIHNGFDIVGGDFVKYDKLSNLIKI